MPVPATARAAFDRQRVRQAKERLAAGEAWRDEGYVFSSTIGSALDPRNVTREFAQLRYPAGLPWLRLHDLRHAWATFLLGQGVEARMVMAILDHSTIRLAMDVYGHVHRGAEARRVGGDGPHARTVAMSGAGYRFGHFRPERPPRETHPPGRQ